MRAALIRESDGLVVNTIDLEQDSEWQAPEGHFIRFDDEAKMGMVWNGEALVEVES